MVAQNIDTHLAASLFTNPTKSSYDDDMKTTIWKVSMIALPTANLQRRWIYNAKASPSGTSAHRPRGPRWLVTISTSVLGHVCLGSGTFPSRENMRTIA